MKRYAAVLKLGIIGGICAAVFGLRIATGAAATLVEGELLHTGMRITPAAAPASLFQSLNPDLPDLPDFTAGQAVSTALSPDGTTLLILTSGYNRVNDPTTGSRVPEWSNEYVFVYDVTGSTPVKRQVLTLPNTFGGIVWNPVGDEFYVSGGRDDNVHVFVKSGDLWNEQLPAIDLGDHPNRSGNYQPMAAGMALSAAGDLLAVANMLYDSVTVLSIRSRAVIGEVDLRPGVIDPSNAGTPGGTYPFWVVIKGNDKAYVSSQRDREIVVIRTIVDLLGMESPGLNDALAAPMADIFEPNPTTWTYAAEVPDVLYATMLPVPAPVATGVRPDPNGHRANRRPLRTAEYWEQAMAGQNFAREDDLSTDAFNLALWVGLRGEHVPYPHVRHGKDLRRNRQQLLRTHLAESARD